MPTDSLSLTTCDELLIIVEHCYELYLQGQLSEKMRPEWNDYLDRLLNGCLKEGYKLPQEVKDQLSAILPYFEALQS